MHAHVHVLYECVRTRNCVRMCTNARGRDEAREAVRVRGENEAGHKGRGEAQDWEGGKEKRRSGGAGGGEVVVGGGF